MVSEIRIYIEGGGQGDTRIRLRQGFHTFLAPLRERATQKNIRWNVVVCGGREDTFDDFLTALKVHSHALNVLLVDSEGPVVGTPCNTSNDATTGSVLKVLVMTSAT